MGLGRQDVTLGCEGGEKIVLAGCKCWVDVWEATFCAGVVDVVSIDRGINQLLGFGGLDSGNNDELSFEFQISGDKELFVLYYILQRPDVGISKLTEVSFDVVIEVNLRVCSVKSHAIIVQSFQRTFTTVNSDSLGYPLVVP